MGNPAEAAADHGEMGERLGPLKARVQHAFDVMREATVRVPRLHPGLSRGLRGPLGRLISAGQGRDAFDQRVAHVEAAEARAQSPATAPAVRSAVYHVTALQLVEIAALLEGCSAAAAEAFHDILEAAAGGASLSAADPALGATLRDLGREGLHAATDLAAASEIVSAEAAGHAARQDQGIAADDLAAADLGWLMALYTTEDERRTHRTAMARAVAG